LTPESNSAQAAEAQARLAQSLLRIGQRDEAKRHSLRALQIARTAADQRIEGMVLNDLGIQADDEGDYGEATDRYAEALALHRFIGNRTNEGGTLSNLGYAAMALGDYDNAGNRFNEARALFGAIGHRRNEGITLINLGIAELNLDHPAMALDAAGQALPMLRSSGARGLEAAALRLQGQAHLALGEAEAADKHLRVSRDLFDELGMTHLALEPMAALAQLAMSTGDRDTAMAEVERILLRQSQGVSLEGTEEPLRVALICHQVLAACGDPRAPAVLCHAHESLMDRAGRISDAARRRSFLERVPYHRQIVQAFAAKSGSSPN
jgi:tetratricopeptide (TPR) repeat protein